MSNVASTLLPFFLQNVASFGNNVAVLGDNVERNFVLSTKSKQIEHVQFVSTLSKGVERTKFRSTLLPKKATLVPKTAIMSKQHCRKNRSTCSIRQRCLDIVAGMDGALLVHCLPFPIYPIRFCQAILSASPHLLCGTLYQSISSPVHRMKAAFKSRLKTHLFNTTFYEQH